MEIRNLEHTDFDTLFYAFERAFADYEIHFEKEEVRSMLQRRGYNPKLSFAAFVNDEIVAFTLNGTGTFNGLPTAYDTGTGTVKEYRGQNLAGTIFTHSIPFLREAGIRQYLLEVLQNNEKATIPWMDARCWIITEPGSSWSFALEMESSMQKSPTVSLPTSENWIFTSMYRLPLSTWPKRHVRGSE